MWHPLLTYLTFSNCNITMTSWINITCIDVGRDPIGQLIDKVLMVNKIKKLMYNEIEHFFLKLR